MKGQLNLFDATVCLSVLRRPVQAAYGPSPWWQKMKDEKKNFDVQKA